MYKIRDAGAKGLGVFATTFIPRGTRILAERPLFSVKLERDAYAASRKISQEDRNWLTELSIDTNKKLSVFDLASAAWNLIRNGTLPTSSAIKEHDTVLAVFRNNNFYIGDGTQAIFRDLCRINHSCVPNSQGNFNTAIGSFAVHAVRPIDIDEEVTVSYLDEHGATRESRQRKLFSGHGFRCTCPICDPSTILGQKSEERRFRMGQRLRQHSEHAPVDEKSEQKEGMKILKSLIEIFEEDGLAGRELSTM